MNDQFWDAGAVSDHGADAGAEHGAPGPLTPKVDDHGADGAADHGADEVISVSDHGADRGADGVAGNLTYGSADPASE
jgi:hypothetical protein